jgi:hypothetical protein
MNKISNAIFVSVLLALCLSSLIEANLKVYQCKNVKYPLSTIKKLEIAKSTGYPVTLTRGENATINIEFQATSKINACKLKIFGELNGKTVPFSATNDDNHCLESIKELKGKKFLLQKNKNYTYSFSLPVKEEYPAVSVAIQYHLMFNQKTILCFTFPAKIV